MVMILNVIGCLLIYNCVKKVLEYTDYSLSQSVPVQNDYKFRYLSHTR